MNWLIAGMSYQIIEIYFMYCCGSKQRRNSNSHRWPLALNTVQASKKVSSAAVDFPPVIKPTLTIVQHGLFVHLLYLSCCWKIFVGRVVLAFLYSDSLLISVFLWEGVYLCCLEPSPEYSRMAKTDTSREPGWGYWQGFVRWNGHLSRSKKLDNIWMQMYVKIDVPVRTFKWCMKLSNMNRSMEALHSSLMLVVGWTRMEKA